MLSDGRECCHKLGWSRFIPAFLQSVWRNTQSIFARPHHVDLGSGTSLNSPGHHLFKTPVQDAYREHELRLQHKIFISYSGADRAFVMELYHELCNNLYNPFVDQESLPKGIPVSMRNIVQEAENSRLAVFYLSVEFLTRNSNPMLELAACVRAGVQLFPVFDTLQVNAIKANYKKWYRAWRKWGITDGQFREFQDALRTLLGVSGIVNIENSTPREFRRRVVEEIRKLVQPEILPDVSDIKGQARLVQFVKDLLTSATQQISHIHQKPLIVGVYGEHGTGKTTLCKVLENHATEFAGLPVCYVHLQDRTSEQLEERLVRMKAVLRSVTYLDKATLDQLDTTSAAKRLLLQHSHDRSVFLIIDNVIASRTTDEAKIYLRGRFKEGSRVLITAHSSEVISRISENCKVVRQIPDLEEEEARQILLQVEELKQQPSALNRCLKLCHLRRAGTGDRRKPKSRHYHPFFLSSLTKSLMEYGPYSYEQLTKRITFLESKSASHEGQIVDLQWLRSLSFDPLSPPALKQIFLDIALCVPGSVMTGCRLKEWLSLMHKSEDIEHSIRVLIRAGLLDGSVTSEKDPLELPLVHDLYYEMAIDIVKEDGSEWLFVKGRDIRMVLDHVQLQQDCGRMTRMVLIDCTFDDLGGNLDLSPFHRLRAIKLQGCLRPINIYLGGMKSLCSLELAQGVMATF